MLSEKSRLDTQSRGCLREYGHRPGGVDRSDLRVLDADPEAASSKMLVVEGVGGGRDPRRWSTMLLELLCERTRLAVGHEIAER